MSADRQTFWLLKGYLINNENISGLVYENEKKKIAGYIEEMERWQLTAPIGSIKYMENIRDDIPNRAERLLPHNTNSQGAMKLGK
jgi:hypothetical protein